MSIDEMAKGYGDKEWSSPTNTSHRLYLHRFEGKHKKDCGHIDVNKKDYIPPKRSNRKADDTDYCLDGEGDIVFQVTIDTEILTITKVVQSKTVKTATNRKNILDKTDNPQEMIQHLASVKNTGSSITVSYGNTLEVKSKNKYGNVQTQYPKLSMQIEIEGGSQIPDLEALADNLIDLVESKLTKIVNDISE